MLICFFAIYQSEFQVLLAIVVVDEGLCGCYVGYYFNSVFDFLDGFAATDVVFYPLES